MIDSFLKLTKKNKILFFSAYKNILGILFGQHLHKNNVKLIKHKKRFGCL